MLRLVCGGEVEQWRKTKSQLVDSIQIAREKQKGVRGGEREREREREGERG